MEDLLIKVVLGALIAVGAGYLLWDRPLKLGQPLKAQLSPGFWVSVAILVGTVVLLLL